MYFFFFVLINQMYRTTVTRKKNIERGMTTSLLLPRPDISVLSRCLTVAVAWFVANASHELQVSWQDGHAVSMDGSKIGVVKERHKISLGGLLEGSDGCALKAQIRFVVLGNFADEPLKGEFAQQQFITLLISFDLSKRHRSGTIAASPFTTTSRRPRFKRGCWRQF